MVDPKPSQIELTRPIYDRVKKLTKQKRDIDANLADEEKNLEDLKKLWGIEDVDLDPNLAKEKLKLPPKK